MTKYIGRSIAVVFAVITVLALATSSFGLEIKGMEIEDGDYTIEVEKDGGNENIEVESPTKLVIEGEDSTATVLWETEDFDYMIVDGKKYSPVEVTDEYSMFEFPLSAYDEPIEVVAGNSAVDNSKDSQYKLTFVSRTIKSNHMSPNAKYGFGIIGILIVVAGILALKSRKKVNKGE